MESLMQGADALQNMAIQMGGDIRWEKVMMLRAVIREGRYNVSSEHLAEKLMETMLASHRRQGCSVSGLALI